MCHCVMCDCVMCDRVMCDCVSTASAYTSARPLSLKQKRCLHICHDIGLHRLPTAHTHHKRHIWRTTDEESLREMCGYDLDTDPRAIFIDHTLSPAKRERRYGNRSQRDLHGLHAFYVKVDSVFEVNPHLALSAAILLPSLVRSTHLLLLNGFHPFFYVKVDSKF